MNKKESEERKIDFAELKSQIDSLIHFVENLPEEFRIPTYEILLKMLLEKTMAITSPSKEEEVKEILKIPIDVKAFFEQYDIPESVLSKLFLIEGEEIRPIYKLETTKKAEAQIQLALLMALENALKSTPSKFQFNIEDVRERCKEMGYYDPANFMRNFKNNAKLFKDLDEEVVELSPIGKEKLAEVILEITER